MEFIANNHQLLEYSKTDIFNQTLTPQRYVKSGTDIDQMLEIGKKIRNG